MPPRRAASSNDDEAQPDSSSESSYRLKLPILHDDNYDTWVKALKHGFFSCGWDSMYERSLARQEEEIEPDEAHSTLERRKAWGVVTQSRSPKLLDDIDEVRLGFVEKLLREIRNYFYSDSDYTRLDLLNMLITDRLENHQTVKDYITYLEKLKKYDIRVDPLYETQA